MWQVGFQHLVQETVLTRKPATGQESAKYNSTSRRHVRGCQIQIFVMFVFLSQEKTFFPFLIMATNSGVTSLHSRSVLCSAPTFEKGIQGDLLAQCFGKGVSGGLEPLPPCQTPQGREPPPCSSQAGSPAQELGSQPCEQALPAGLVQAGSQEEVATLVRSGASGRPMGWDGLGGKGAPSQQLNNTLRQKPVGDVARNSTGRAPTLSTTKPAKAWPKPETTKQVLTSKPSCA